MFKTKPGHLLTHRVKSRLRRVPSYTSCCSGNQEASKASKARPARLEARLASRIFGPLPLHQLFLEDYCTLRSSNLLIFRWLTPLPFALRSIVTVQSWTRQLCTASSASASLQQTEGFGTTGKNLECLIFTMCF